MRCTFTGITIASGPGARVTRNRPRPGTVSASTISTLPPATVAGRPTATPDRAARQEIAGRLTVSCPVCRRRVDA